jgi:4'-phosphopantetheinyl transferase EntD
MELLSRILAPGLFAAEMEDVGQPVFLDPQEAILVAGVSNKRRRDFTLGRGCAREALAALGYDEAVIGKGEDGAPLLPAGVVGSITHTKGYAAALVAEARHFSGVGLDAERVGGVTEDLWPRLFDGAERDHLLGLDPASRHAMATLFFSAKEACYKAWAGNGALLFREIHVVPEEGGFSATRANEKLHGRYAVQGDLMLTAVWF